MKKKTVKTTVTRRRKEEKRWAKFLSSVKRVLLWLLYDSLFECARLVVRVASPIGVITERGAGLPLPLLSEFSYDIFR